MCNAPGMLRALSVALIALLWMAPAPAPAADELAFEWLTRMGHAGMMLSYDGYLVYQAGGKIEPMRVIYKGAKDDTKARMISLTGEAREVIIDSTSVICVFPNDRITLKSEGKRKRRALFSRLEGISGDEQRKRQLQAHYRLSVADGGRVAGRDTAMVDVQPKDDNRYGHRLYLDRENGLLLRSELLGADKVPLEQFMYASITVLDHVDDALLRPHLEGKSYTSSTTEVAREVDSESHWQVTWLPAGFEMANRVQDQGMVPEMPVEHHVYSDGLSSVSVFVEELEPGAEKLDGLSTIGAVNAFGCMIDGFQITAVGEVPGMTVARICRFVKPAGGLRNP